MTPDRAVLAEDEHPHPSSGEPGWVEAWLFDVVDEHASMSIEFLLWPDTSRVAFHTSVIRPRQALVSLSETAIDAPKGRRLEVRAPGLWTDIGIQTELEHVTVDIEAFGVALDDPEDVFRGAYGIRTAVGCELEWETASAIHPGPTPNSYQVPCDVHGELLLGDETIEIDGWGWRSHRWGVAHQSDRAHQRGRTAGGDWTLAAGQGHSHYPTVIGVGPVIDVSRGVDARLHQELRQNGRGDLVWQRTIG